MSDNGPARTMFANKAMQIHELFAARFENVKVGSKVVRKVQVQAIDVETTGGGQLARMSISLVPDDSVAGISLVCGWIDVGNNTVRMRSHATLNGIFKAKTSRFFDLPAPEYDAFVEDARAFVNASGYQLEIYDEETHYKDDKKQAAEKHGRTAKGQNSSMLIIAIAAAVLIIAAAAWFSLR